MSVESIEIKADQGVILLVDDNPTNLGLLFDSLSNSGFRLLVAEDGEGALEQVNYVKPDLILLDVMMPGMDGFETCRRLKSNSSTQDIPVIFMTALTDTIDKVTGLSIGAVDYITKPIQPDEVLARIKTHLMVHGLKRQLQEQNHQLQQEVQERQRVEQSLKLLLRAVSHDLRNPVTGMLMVLKNLLGAAASVREPDHTAPPSSAAPFAASGSSDAIVVHRTILERMVESGDRQLKLINSLLEAHANEAHHLDLVCETVSLTELVSSIIQDVTPLVEKSEATLKNQIAAGLPPVLADPNQIWRVFENLIVNALKHNPPGLHIVADAKVQDGMIRCIIQDDGVGIPHDQCDRLFDPYNRGANSRHTHGLGLGLYLCRQIVVAHGGEIGVESEPGQGATFWFTLPLALT
jgi:two-component system sensor histidine kinase/response regulator